MKLTWEQLEQDMGRLKLSERLSLVEDVWNSIASQNDALPCPNGNGVNSTDGMHRTRLGLTSFVKRMRSTMSYDRNFNDQP